MEKFTIDELKEFADRALKARERAKEHYEGHRLEILARKHQQYEQRKANVDPNAPKKKQGRPRKYFPPDDLEKINS